MTFPSIRGGPIVKTLIRGELYSMPRERTYTTECGNLPSAGDVQRKTNYKDNGLDGLLLSISVLEKDGSKLQTIATHV